MTKITRFTDAQLSTLRREYATIETVAPARLVQFHTIFHGCSDDALKQLASANIKFVSKLASNAVVRRLGWN